MENRKKYLDAFKKSSYIYEVYIDDIDRMAGMYQSYTYSVPKLYYQIFQKEIEERFSMALDNPHPEEIWKNLKSDFEIIHGGALNRLRPLIDETGREENICIDLINRYPLSLEMEKMEHEYQLNIKTVEEENNQKKIRIA